MKRAISISLGSSKHDKSVKIKLGGEEILVERVGTDDDELNGLIDGLGLKPAVINL